MQIRLITLSGLLALLVHGGAFAASDYRLGQGITQGSFMFSGYGNVALEAPNGGPAVLALDDLSLYVAGHVNRWFNPFIEAELSNITLAQESGASWSSGSFVPERVYNDSRLDTNNTLRIGKILSPVGDWNLVHAAPLVPTVIRPLTTYRSFSEYANGVSWVHEAGWGGGPDWQLYWQPGTEWLQRPDSVAPRHYRNVVGAHLGWNFGLVDMLGLSVQSGELTRTDEHYTLLGLNARRTFGPLTLEGEAVSTRWSGSAPRAHDTEWGAYALADYAFTERWHAIAEYEHYQDHQIGPASENSLLGITYKPGPAMAWKLEYLNQTGVSADLPSGWFGSFAVLF